MSVNTIFLNSRPLTATSPAAWASAKQWLQTVFQAADVALRRLDGGSRAQDGALETGQRRAPL